MNENNKEKQNAQFEEAKRAASVWLEAEKEMEEPVDRWDRAVQLFEMAASICLILSMIFCGAMAYRFVRFYSEPTRLEIRVAAPETNGETTNESGAQNDAANER